MTPINETKSTYKGREVYAQTASSAGSCDGCALDHEPSIGPCMTTGPCTPSWRSDRTNIIWVYAEDAGRQQ